MYFIRPVEFLSASRHSANVDVTVRTEADIELVTVNFSVPLEVTAGQLEGATFCLDESCDYALSGLKSLTVGHQNTIRYTGTLPDSLFEHIAEAVVGTERSVSLVVSRENLTRRYVAGKHFYEALRHISLVM